MQYFPMQKSYQCTQCEISVSISCVVLLFPARGSQVYWARALRRAVQDVYSSHHPPGGHRGILKLSHSSSCYSVPNAGHHQPGEEPVWAAGSGVDGTSQGDDRWICTKIQRQHCAEKSKTRSRQDI